MGVRLTQPRQHLLVTHQGAGPESTREDDHIGVWHLIEGAVGDQREVALLGPLRSRLERDEADARARQALEHLVGTDRVERGQSVEDRDRDLHRAYRYVLSVISGR